MKKSLFFRALSWIVVLLARLTGSREVYPKAATNYALIEIVLLGGAWAWWCRVWGMVAMTLLDVVCVARPEVAYDPVVMAHEARHVHQQIEAGLPRYSALYAWDFAVGFVRLGDWRAAYRQVRWEVDARRHAGEE